MKNESLAVIITQNNNFINNDKYKIIRNMFVYNVNLLEIIKIKCPVSKNQTILYCLIFKKSSIKTKSIIYSYLNVSNNEIIKKKIININEFNGSFNYEDYCDTNSLKISDIFTVKSNKNYGIILNNNFIKKYNFDVKNNINISQKEKENYIKNIIQDSKYILENYHKNINRNKLDISLFNNYILKSTIPKEKKMKLSDEIIIEIINKYKKNEHLLVDMNKLINFTKKRTYIEKKLYINIKLTKVTFLPKQKYYYKFYEYDNINQEYIYYTFTYLNQKKKLYLYDIKTQLIIVKIIKQLLSK